MKNLILSLFPGIDLLGKGFESEGFCVVRGPDVIWGGDVRSFHPASHAFTGIIGGPPCQDFSALRRCDPTGYGVEMLAEYARCVTEARPDWFLMENVPRVPSIEIPGYQIQRFNLAAKECGANQARLRCFQFGSLDGKPLVIHRGPVASGLSPAATATEGNKPDRRSFADFCELQGLPRDFDLPGLSVAAKYRAVGNGVPLQMGRVLAIAIKGRLVTTGPVRVCVCECGRPVPAGRTMATPACRKRMERKRRDTAGVTGPGPVTAGPSLFPVTELDLSGPGLSPVA
jgi:DNA (cytosine-5)-methyltransferase 1